MRAELNRRWNNAESDDRGSCSGNRPDSTRTADAASGPAEAFMRKVRDVHGLARTAWITFLFAAGPLALFCLAMTILGMRALYWEDSGPVEEPPSSSLEAILVRISVVAFFVTWILGFTMAHRCNRGMLRVMPFLVNLLPMTGLMWLVVRLERDEGSGMGWMTAYTGIVAALLGVGMIAAVISARLEPKAQGQGTGPDEGSVPI